MFPVRVIPIWYPFFENEMDIYLDCNAIMRNVQNCDVAQLSSLFKNYIFVREIFSLGKLVYTSSYAI